MGLFFSLLFILNYPFKLIATELGYAVIDSAHYGSEWQNLALLLSNISAFLFIIPLFIWSKRPPPLNTLALPDTKGIRWAWLICYLLLIVCSYGLDPFLRLVSQSQLRELITLRGENRLGGALSAIALQSAQIALILFCLSFARHIHRISGFTKLMLAILSIGLSYALLGISGSKNLALQPFAFFILSYNWVRYMQGRPIRLQTVFALGILGVTLLSIAGYIRGFAAPDQEYPEGRTVYAFQQLMAAFDAPDNLTVILYQMNSITWGDLHYQPTIDNVFRSIIPRFIWSDKPLVMGNQRIMAEYIPERYTDYTGEVLAPSMAGEMIVSGGVVFMVFASVVLGILYTILYRIAHNVRSNTFSFLLYTWMTLNIFNLLRSGTGIIGPFIVFTILSTSILWFASFFSKPENT